MIIEATLKVLLAMQQAERELKQFDSLQGIETKTAFIRDIENNGKDSTKVIGVYRDFVWCFQRGKFYCYSPGFFLDGRPVESIEQGLRIMDSLSETPQIAFEKYLAKRAAKRLKNKEAGL